MCQNGCPNAVLGCCRLRREPLIVQEEEEVLVDAVLSVFHATMITFDMTRCIKFVENHEGKGFFRIEQAAQK
jgi:hypothetical protein